MTKKKMKKLLKKYKVVAGQLDQENKKLKGEVQSLKAETNDLLKDYGPSIKTMKRLFKEIDPSREISESNMVTLLVAILQSHGGAMYRNQAKEILRTFFKKEKANELMPYEDRRITKFDQVFNNMVSHRKQREPYFIDYTSSNKFFGLKRNES